MIIGKFLRLSIKGCCKLLYFQWFLTGMILQVLLTAETLPNSLAELLTVMPKCESVDQAGIDTE